MDSLQSLYGQPLFHKHPSTMLIAMAEESGTYLYELLASGIVETSYDGAFEVNARNSSSASRYRRYQKRWPRRWVQTCASSWSATSANPKTRTTSCSMCQWAFCTTLQTISQPS